MSISYDYDVEKNIIRVKAKGVISTDDILNYVTTIIKNKNIKKGFVEIVDIESVEDFTLRYSDTTIFSDVWIKYMEKGCIGTIIYAPNDLGFGVMRMLQATILRSEEAEKISFNVVRTKEDIYKYLKQIRT